MVNKPKSSKDIDAVNNQEPMKEKRFYIRNGTQSFDQKHHRITTYINNELYDHIQYLREQEKIHNITKLYNDALVHYLKHKNLM